MTKRWERANCTKGTKCTKCIKGTTRTKWTKCAKRTTGAKCAKGTKGATMAEWAKKNSLIWIEKARKFPEIADTALEQVSKLEEYQNANEERHEKLMSKIYQQSKFNNILLIIFVILILFLIIT